MSDPTRTPTGLDQALDQAADTWRRSTLLRLGALAIVGIVGLEAFWVSGDRIAALLEESRSTQAATEQLRLQLREARWERLMPELQGRVDALQGGLWPGDDPALVQAGLQDWLRTAAKASNIVVRELTVARQVPLGPGAVGNPVSTTATETEAPGLAPAASRRAGLAYDVDALERGGLAVWQVRMKVEFERNAALAFLNAVGANPQWLVLGGMQLELTRSPALLSLELRALSRSGPGAR
jgi:hypothetical protein